MVDPSFLFLLITGFILAVVGVIFYPDIVPGENKKVEKTINYIHSVRALVGILALFVSLFLGIKFILFIVTNLKWFFILISAFSLFVTGLILSVDKLKSSQITFFKSLADIGKSLDKAFGISKNPRITALGALIIGAVTVVLAFIQL